MDLIWQWLTWFLFHRVTRYVAAWAICLVALYVNGLYAWDAFAVAKRNDGNNGHVAIDFGGQWLMGALLVQGEGPHLYHRNHQRQLLLRAMPYEDEVPDEQRPEYYPADRDQEKGKRDAEKLMGCFMGADSRAAADTVSTFLAPVATPHGLGAATLLLAGREEWKPEQLETVTKPRVGGPLYPPVQALYMAPLGLLRPQPAYRTNQALCLVWALLTGLGVSYLTRGKFWWPVAVTLILVYPGFKGSIQLGQNAPLTLCILVWGWALLARKHPIWGGMVWGLFAFKPVWAAAFFLVPFVTGRPRFCLAMIGTGAALCLATLPFVGFEPWKEWLSVGRDAAALYNYDENWVFLSRDLLGIPRRWMLDYSLPSPHGDRIEIAVVGWALWGLVLELTLMLTVLRWRQRRDMTGPAPAFLFLAAWMLCYHFMYYDALLSVFPFFLLCAEPRRYLEPILVAFLPLPAGRLPVDLTTYYRPGLPGEFPSPVPLLPASHRHLLVLNRMVPTVLLLLLAVEHVFSSLGLGVSLTGYWSPEMHKATISWAEPVGPEGTAKRTVTSEHKWAERPIKLSSSLYGEGQPWDTYVLMFLWVWCGGLWLFSKPFPAKFEAVPDSIADVILVPVDEPAPPAIRPA